MFLSAPIIRGTWSAANAPKIDSWYHFDNLFPLPRVLSIFQVNLNDAASFPFVVIEVSVIK